MLSADSIPEDTIRKWLSRWKKEVAFWETEKKRGRKNLLDTLPEPVRTEWTKQVTAVRMQGESVTARVAAALGRGIVAEKTPSLLERHGGVSVRAQALFALSPLRFRLILCGFRDTLPGKILLFTCQPVQRA